ncbi:MAG TPA: alkaline phosphatase family protein [Bacillota bacterium]|jgi:2,3-bisphosphoglycerate-independent phosphoglycerate mutase|nr:alkaline phosphatase family protein [Bacillota bacterium]HOL08521.1 alkaline phosphatase family protein [Bacillota bacterium]HPO96998.1 alkaline phosphatase family protein [Bacillota bacterium]
MPLLMFFIDGFGIGTADQEFNPFLTAKMDFFDELLKGEKLAETTNFAAYCTENRLIVPLDATLNVVGLPQSATGQTTLLTGINASRHCGRHIHGFPTIKLKALLQEHSIFKILRQNNLSATFANTFTAEYFSQPKPRYSATTLAAMAGDCRLRMVADLVNGEAVYQDITNEILKEKGYAVSVISPEEAALNLVKIAAQNDFTLFEYFQTDRCGHKQDRELALLLLNRLDRFIGTISSELDQYQLDLIITSDHGNIENLAVKTHTYNPVPLIALGNNISCFDKARSIEDIYSCIIDYFNLKLME